MFDFAWSEIVLIAGVALVVIGPKDLPVAIRAITGFVKKARRMAGEFQTHVDEMMRDADLKDVKDSLHEIRNFDIRSTVAKVIDPDRSLRDTMASVQSDVSASIDLAATPKSDTISIPDGELPPNEPPGTGLPPPVRIAAPAFIPPMLVPFAEVPGEPPKEPPPPPSFIPPVAMLQRPPT
jgi:sec-independent protein translocase protein TatB